jgi:hypothetical protein
MGRGACGGVAARDEDVYLGSKSMPAQVAVTIIDEIPGRGRQVAFKLELWSEKVTARELIERRVRHEVDVHNVLRSTAGG